MNRQETVALLAGVVGAARTHAGYFDWYVRRINHPLDWKIDILEGPWNNETDGNEELDAKWKSKEI